MNHEILNNPKKKHHIIRNIFICILIFILYVIADSNLGFIKISKYTVTSTNLPAAFNGVKILVLSDLHSREFGKDSKYLIKKINDAKPDYIVTTGDMMSSWDQNADVFLLLLDKLDNKYPLYFIYGNHEIANEYAYGEGSTFADELEIRGVTVLNNEKIVLVRDNEKINIYGLNQPLWAYSAAKTEHTPKFSKLEIVKRIGTANLDEFNILLAHTPTKLDAYSEWGADLVLSGHMHGGMIQVPFIGGLLSPEVELFPKYDKGYFISNETHMILSAGLGNGVFPLRILNKPELCLVTLKVKNN
ncbi:MAG: metallophosphoesterase [Clostridiales bacterium]|jgi:predicted MPP superfamily phosphohydrolase|nr:metallophosphoesterase [Clostridiales bacterium]